MDPDEALKRIRKYMSMIEQTLDRNGNFNARKSELEGLTEAFEGLDSWLSKGGFLPKEWNAKRD